jgi:acetoin utilization deacetylase AcuC-like enzyme
MTTALITHPACLKHEPPYGHPERVARLESVLDGLKGGEFAPLKRIEAPQATKAAIARVHDQAYIDDIMASVPKTGIVQLDSDTAMSPGSGEAILRAAGALVEAVNIVIRGETKNAFCAVRPPGHHALPDHAMGFCIFNNVAVGAAHARAEHGLKKIAVVDFDVHHGNGTQAMFYKDKDLFYGSTHQSPLYPGTGHPYETGVAHNILNLPLPPGAGGPEFRRAFNEGMIPALERFEPELVMISAGFDAHRDDPLASLRFDESDYGWATEALCAVAAKACKGRVVSTLEGGYDLSALARSAQAHVRALMTA